MLNGNGFFFRGRWYPPIRGGDGTDDAGDGDGETPNPAGGNGGAGEGNGGTTQGGAKPYATFPTQQSLSERLARAKQSALTDAAKEAGFDSIEAFQTHLKEEKARRERDQGELETHRQRVNTLSSENAQLKSTLRNVALRSAVESVASQLGFQSPDDAYGLVNWSDLELSDDGNVDREAVKKRLADLTKTKAYLLKPDAQAAASKDANTNGQARQNGTQQQRASAANPSRPAPGRRELSQEKVEELQRRHPILKRL